jgi:hypothetical protein
MLAADLVDRGITFGFAQNGDDLGVGELALPHDLESFRGQSLTLQVVRKTGGTSPGGLKLVCAIIDANKSIDF